MDCKEMRVDLRVNTCRKLDTEKTPTGDHLSFKMSRQMAP